MKKIFKTLLFTVLIFTLSGCASSDPGKASSGNPLPQAEDTLRIAYPNDPEGLDPQRTSAVSTFNITGNIYEPLLAATPDWGLSERLAESYAVSKDGLEITFKLREGVLFHNGREMKASDVKFSFERLMESESPKAKYYANISKIEENGDYEITFKTSELDVNLSLLFAYPWAVIFPEECADELKTAPVGTGAYKFIEWTPQEKVLLTRNDDYYGQKAKIKNIELKLIPDYTSQLAALKTGDVDITEITGDQIELLSLEEGFKVYSEPLNAVQLLALNMENSILSDVRVRQAIACAINKDDIIETTVWGYGDKIGSHIPYKSPDYVDTNGVMPYNPEKAKELLADAGYPGGFSIKLALPKNYQIHVDAGQVIADQLSRVGIDAQIEMMEWGEWMDTVYKGKDYDMTVVALSGRLDSYDFLARYNSGSGDFVSLITGEADSLLEAASKEADPDARKAVFAEIQNILAEKLPCVYIQTPHKMFGLSDAVEGFRIYPIDIYEYKDVSFKN